MHQPSGRVFCYNLQHTSLICDLHRVSFILFVSGWSPYAHFRALEELRATNSQQAPLRDVEAVRNDNNLMLQSLGHNLSSPPQLYDVESGRP